MIARTHEEIEAQIREIQSKKKRINKDEKERVGLGECGYFDRDIYDSKDKYEGYAKSIAADNFVDDDEDVPSVAQKTKKSYTAPATLLKEIAETETENDPFADRRRKTISEKEEEYRHRHRHIVISPERVDPFADGGKTPAIGSRTYKDVMQEQWLKREEKDLRNRLITKAKEGLLKSSLDSGNKEIGDKNRSVKREDRLSSMNKKHKRSRSSSSSSEYTDSDSPKQKFQKSTRSPEDRHHRRKHHRHHKNRSDNSSSDNDTRHKHRDHEKNDRQKSSSLFDGVKVKEEPLSEDERGRKLKNRVTEDSSRRGDSRNARDSRRKNDKSDSRDQNNRNRGKPIKEEEQSEKEPEWGKKEIKTEKKEPPKNNAKPDFGLSGKLTEDANTFRGVVIKYSEPPEARKPKRRWRLYPFKGEQTLPVLHIHRQSAYLLGRDHLVADIRIDHPSCSKQHAALQYRLVPFTRDDGSKGRQIKPYIIDLESANGTYLNNQKIEAKKYYELKERDVVKFGYSSREYVLLHEHSKDSENDDDVQNDG